MLISYLVLAKVKPMDIKLREVEQLTSFREYTEKEMDPTLWITLYWENDDDPIYQGEAFYLWDDIANRDDYSAIEEAHIVGMSTDPQDILRIELRAAE